MQPQQYHFHAILKPIKALSPRINYEIYLLRDIHFVAMIDWISLDQV